MNEVAELMKQIAYELAGPCAPEKRIVLLNQLFHVTRGNLKLMFAMLDNDVPESDVRRTAKDNLDALYGFLTERLNTAPASEGE